jgi:hypothetical protein
MFRPVQGSALEAFDLETRKLYTKRVSDPTTSAELSQLQRRGRNHMPVIVDRSN